MGAKLDTRYWTNVSPSELGLQSTKQRNKQNKATMTTTTVKPEQKNPYMHAGYAPSCFMI